MTSHNLQHPIYFLTALAKYLPDLDFKGIIPVDGSNLRIHLSDTYTGMIYPS